MERLAFWEESQIFLSESDTCWPNTSYIYIYILEASTALRAASSSPLTPCQLLTLHACLTKYCITQHLNNQCIMPYESHGPTEQHAWLPCANVDWAFKSTHYQRANERYFSSPTSKTTCGYFLIYWPFMNLQADISGGFWFIWLCPDSIWAHTDNIARCERISFLYPPLQLWGGVHPVLIRKNSILLWGGVPHL